MSIEGDGASRRKKRIQQIYEIIERADGIPIGVALGLIERHTGLTDKRARDYIKILERTKEVYWRGLKLYVKKS